MDDFKLKLLPKKPIGEDLFEGKSQENIAKIISENIKCNDDNHKMIGIEGKWGSGKSNVIELLRNRLDKSKYKFLSMMYGDIRKIYNESLFYKN